MLPKRQALGPVPSLPNRQHSPYFVPTTSGGTEQGKGHRAFPGLKFQNQMLGSRASVGKCLAFHSTLRAQWSLRATSIQCHIWFWLYLATEEQPRGPEGQLSAGCCLG